MATKAKQIPEKGERKVLAEVNDIGEKAISDGLDKQARKKENIILR